MVAASLLLLMQAMALQHQLDVDHHSNGEPCELCLHLSALGHGMSGTLPTLQATQAPIPALTPPFISLVPSLNNSYQTRAPPTHS